MADMWLSNDVSTKAINDFFERSKVAGNEIHCFELFHNGEIKIRISQNPYSCDAKREVYSLSKTFTSTAVGIAVGQGVLQIDERITDIFPEKCPEKTNENLKNMTVRDLLTMRTGHEKCVMSQMYSSDDCVREFLFQEVKYESGTHFVYNTGATCVLGAIIKKRTGMNLFDYVNKYVLKPLEINNSYWTVTKDGTNEGGVGLHISCDDILKFGIMYLNKGIYNGKRIVSEQWIDEATYPHSDCSVNGNPDWCAGYGYQLWMNERGGFRADGAFGQLCLVLPQYNAVVAVSAKCVDMQQEIDNIFTLLEKLYLSEKEEIKQLGFSTLGISAKREYPFLNKIISLCDNVVGFKQVYIEYEGDNLAIRFSDGIKEQTLLAGNGEYIRSSYSAKWRKPKIVGLMNPEFEEIVNCAACYKATADGLEVLVRILNTPNSETIKIYLKDKKLNIDFLGNENKKTVYDEAKKLTEV